MQSFKLNRRNATHVLVGSLLPAATWAQQDYPNRPVKVLLGFPPGSSTDISARILAQEFAKSLKQPFVVENRPGAGGNIATMAVVRSPPDGYTLLMAAGASTTFEPALQKQRQFDPVNDLVPLGLTGVLSPIIVVSGKSPYRTLGQLLAAAKAEPDKLTYGFGSSSYNLLMERLKIASGASIRPIPYKGPVESKLDLLAGRIDVSLDVVASAQGQIDDGSLRVLAVYDPVRNPALPDVPTIAESGFPDLTYVGWIGMMAPQGTPAPIVRKLHEEILRITASPEAREKMAGLSMQRSAKSPAEISKLIADDLRKNTDAAQRANLQR